MKLTASPFQIEAAKEAVAKEYGIHPDFFAIPSKSKSQVTISDARFMLCVFLIVATGCSKQQLGRLLNRTTNSIRHEVTRMTKWMIIYPSLRKRYDRIVTDYFFWLCEFRRNNARKF